MTTALAWIRKSKGSDDDIGLQQQRETVPDYAADLADDVKTLDLGVQTGFSSLSRDDTGLLDHREAVQTAVEDIRAGAYAYLVAYDDRRICRDDYLSVIEYACVQGNCELAFVSDDVATDDLAYDIHRRVERQTKEEEIRKAKAAIQERLDRGYDHGPPPFGMEYDADGHYQVPDPAVYPTVERIFGLRDDGETLEAISEKTGVPVSTTWKVLDRREWYREREDMVGWGE